MGEPTGIDLPSEEPGLIPTKEWKEEKFKNGEWNKYRVVAKGPRIQVWLNDEQIEDLKDEESSQKGFIALQVHGIKSGTGPFEVRWRNIKIKE